MRRVYFLKPLSSKSLFFGTDHTSRKEKKTVYIVIVYYSFFFFFACVKSPVSYLFEGCYVHMSRP